MVKNNFGDEYMRKKVLTQQCNACDDCKMNGNNQLYCDWGEGKGVKILLPPKRKKGYPKCNLILS
jgi:hypothetical protein